MTCEKLREKRYLCSVYISNLFPEDIYCVIPVPSPSPSLNLRPRPSLNLRPNVLLLDPLVTEGDRFAGEAVTYLLG